MATIVKERGNKHWINGDMSKELFVKCIPCKSNMTDDDFLATFGGTERKCCLYYVCSSSVSTVLSSDISTFSISIALLTSSIAESEITNTILKAYHSLAEDVMQRLRQTIFNIFRTKSIRIYQDRD